MNFEFEISRVDCIFRERLREESKIKENGRVASHSPKLEKSTQNKTYRKGMFQQTIFSIQTESWLQVVKVGLLAA